MIKIKLKKILISLLTVMCLLPSFTINAEEEMLKGFTIDVNTLQPAIKKYISSLRLEEQEDGSFALYVNNAYIGSRTGNSFSFNYNPINSVTLGMSFDLVNNNVDFTSTELVYNDYKSRVSFTTSEDGNSVIATFYPNSSSLSGASSKTVLGNGGVYNFGTFTARLGDGTYSFNVTLDSNDNKAYIIPNSGSVLTFDINAETVTRTLYFEWIVEQHPLEMQYMKKASLAKYPFELSQYASGYTAQTVTYSDSDFTRAIQGEQLELINVTTKEKIYVPLEPTITYWQRTTGYEGATGTGVYNETLQRVVVVCQWWQSDEKCVALRNSIGEPNRMFAIYGINENFPSYKKYTTLVDTDKMIRVYDDDKWIQMDSWPTVESTAKVQYSYRRANWTDWTDWTTTVWPNTAFSGGGAKFESARFYRNRSYSWKDTTGWHLTNDCPVSSTAQGIYRTTQEPMCGVDYRECQHADCGINASTPYIYSNFGGWSTSKYGYQNGCAYRRGQNAECGTTYINRSCSHQVSYSNNCGKCGEGQSCKQVTEGYTCKKMVSSWRSNTECKARCTGAYGCTGNTCYGTGTCQRTVNRCSNYCKSCTLTEGYNCGYNETNTCTSYTCPNSRSDNYAYCHTKACGGEVAKMCTQYKCQAKQYGAWSDYDYKDNCPNDYWAECGDSITKYRYSNRIWQNWSSWIDTTSSKGNNSQEVEYKYRFNNGVEQKEKKSIEFIKEQFEEIGELPNMTKSLIENKQSQITKKMKFNYTCDLDELLDKETGGIYVLYKDAEKYINSNSLTDTEKHAKVYFINKNLFIPYFYVTKHPRAEKKNVPVSGYNDDSAQLLTTAPTNNTESQPDVPLESYDVKRTKNTRVIYFDYKNPLTNYQDELPENWKGYEYLLDEIRNTDLDEYIIEAELSKQDLIDMRDYLRSGGYNDDNCEMLRRFSYIFKTKDGDLSDFLNGHTGCKVEE